MEERRLGKAEAAGSTPAISSWDPDHQGPRRSGNADKPWQRKVWQRSAPTPVELGQEERRIRTAEVAGSTPVTGFAERFGAPIAAATNRLLACTRKVHVRLALSASGRSTWRETGLLTQLRGFDPLTCRRWEMPVEPGRTNELLEESGRSLERCLDEHKSPTPYVPIV